MTLDWRIMIWDWSWVWATTKREVCVRKHIYIYINEKGVDVRLTVTSGELMTYIAHVTVKFTLNAGPAVFERAAEVAITFSTVAIIVGGGGAIITAVLAFLGAASALFFGFLDAFLFLFCLAEAGFEFLDLFVLGSVHFVLPALVDDSIVEVDARDECAGDG